MAKWGEGDPRWIVEERPDATNVNNWHWTEKNATPWSKSRLTELLKGLMIETENGTVVTVTELSRLDGEATANNRKAKLIFLYEWEIKCKWEGVNGDEDEKVEGELEIPNLSDEFTAEEINVEVSCKSSSPLADKCKELLRTEGVAKIRSQLAVYIKELREEFSKGLVLPTKNSSNNLASVNADNAVLSKAKNEVTINTSRIDKMKIGVQISTKSLLLKESFKCSAEELFNVFTKPQMVEAFTRAPAQMELRKGGKFVLFHGMVNGEFTDILEGKKLGMRWRLKPYPSGHFSEVLLHFDETADSTELRLEQSFIPENNLAETEDGWKRHYFDNIKRTFGFGALLL